MAAAYLKLVVFTPLSHASKIRQALAEAGAGRLGNYDSCSFSSRGQGRFRGRKGSHPAIGRPGKLETVAEERVEALVSRTRLKSVLLKIRAAHPYEEPAIDIYPLENLPALYASRKKTPRLSR